MSDPQYERVKEIYYEAAMLDAAERDTFINRTCNGDHALRDELERLFRADAGVGEFLEQPAVSSGALRSVALQSLADAAGAPLPERLGRYRILRLLGEGGMGSVYEAEQDSPKRRVALKALRAGSMQPRMLQRFQREVEVLGRLQHPNIARIYDAGVAEMPLADGRSARVPFFAMELIDGCAITAYAEQRGLGMRDRLALMAEVCDAVHYGHQHGIVHRDLKPANVLVGISSVEAATFARPDGTPHAMPAPKVIDFGVARVTNADIALTTLATDAGQMIGTLAYMSPEQVRGNPLEIDARCDIYALGVIGYELLTGRLPYKVAGKIAPEAARIIRDAEPSRMSSISRVYRGDVETIFAKALEKEPSRRYDSAAALAADMRRFLNDEPIVARPPTLRYQLAKFSKRHKEFVAGLALVFIVLVAGVIGTSIALVYAIRQEHAAEIARTDALNSAADARKESERAMKSSADAQRASSAVRRILEFARPGIPGGGRDIKVVDMLDRAAEEILGELKDAPEIELSLRRTLGQTYSQLGVFDATRQHFERAMELVEQVHGSNSTEHFDIFAEAAITWLSMPSEIDAGRRQQLASRLDEMIAIADTRLPPAHPVVQRLRYATSLMWGSLWQHAASIPHLEELLATIRDLPPNERAVSEIDVMSALAGALAWTMRLEESQAMANSVIELTTENPEIRHLRACSNSMNLLSYMHANHQRLPEAIVFAEKSYNMQASVLGPQHPWAMACAHQLWSLCLRANKLEDALGWVRVQQRGSESIGAAGVGNLTYQCSYEGGILDQLGRPAEAKNAFARAVDLRRKEIGDDWLALEWFRGSVLVGGGFHETWASDTLRRQTRLLMDIALQRAPTRTFKMSDYRWSDFTFRIQQWDGDRYLDFASGGLARLKSQPDADSGVYRVEYSLPCLDREAIVIEEMMLIAPWSLDSYRAFYGGDPVKWTEPLILGPHESAEASALVFRGAFGPMRAELSFGLKAQAAVSVPPGRYAICADIDDGVRITVDGREVINSWMHRKTSSSLQHEIDLAAGPHAFTVEYFQHGEGAMLWLRLKPVNRAESANAPEIPSG